MNCFFKSYLIYICHSRRLRESMQLLILALAQMSAVRLLFSDCFLQGALSSILSTTLAGWVGALRFHQTKTTSLFVRAYTYHVQTTGPTPTPQWTQLTRWPRLKPCSTWEPGAFFSIFTCSARTFTCFFLLHFHLHIEQCLSGTFLHFHLPSVNIYMFHGGTSFGFTAGSNYFHSSVDGFQVTPTRSEIL